MGKAGRFACILTPMLLTLASLICFIIVMMGQTPWKGNNAPATDLGKDLYFFKVRSPFRPTAQACLLTPPQADTSNMTLDSKTILDKLPQGIKPNNAFLDALRGKADSKDLKDFYQVGLFSYCEGDINNKTGEEKITYCSARKFQFHFDPLKVWDMNGTSLQEALGSKYEDGMNVYKKVAGWMNWAFVITLILTISELVVGIFAVFSRWGSFVTTIVSTVSFLFLICSSLSTSTFADPCNPGPSRLRHCRSRHRHSNLRHTDGCL